MIVKHNIKTYSISWLRSSYDKNTATGIILNYYIPEELDELVSLCKDLYKRNEPFRIVGHTSNVYFLPDSNIPNLISTLKLRKWEVQDEFLICECGVNVKELTKEMIGLGAEGFAGMIDLPGTIGGAIYGNSSVSHYSISNLLDTITLLNEDGQIISLTKGAMQYSVRSSAMKRQEIKGVILSCKLRLKFGNAEKEMAEASRIHLWRKENQPGPLNNLGTTVLSSRFTIKGWISSLTARILYLGKPVQLRRVFVMKLMGKSYLCPYLHGYNRFIWKDSKAHMLFSKYIEFIRDFYTTPMLEIEVW